jgi:uncharacterized membrane protein
MNRFKYFLKTTILGGVTVILPIAVLVFIFKWLFKVITNIIQPFTNIIIERADLQEIFADVIVIFIILTACFIIGMIIKTKIGRFIHMSLEDNLLSIAPGYKMIKETIMQFLGKSKPPFSDVAIVQPFGNNTKCTGFVTDTHENGYYSIFVPTAPNPTSGFIYHLEKKYVQIIDVPIEQAMRSILSCGAGSESLLTKK